MIIHQGEAIYPSLDRCRSRRSKKRQRLLWPLMVLGSIASIGAQIERVWKTDRWASASGRREVTAKIHFNGVVARPFRVWDERIPLPCFEMKAELSNSTTLGSRSDIGFLYLKPFKTGSSTTSGINLRIARNVAKRQNKNFEFCDARFDHGPSKNPAAQMFGNRIKNESFLWTIIREPTHRVVSQFFHFAVSRGKVEPSDENFINFIKKTQPEMKRDYYLRSLSLEANYSRRRNNPSDTANHILGSYDFIGITERMDESYVVLMMLLNLRMSDILYLSAKSKGSYDAGGKNGQCTYIWPSFVSKGMKTYFNSADWQDRVKNDVALYRAAYKSLDLTIDLLGRQIFERNLEKFRSAKQLANERCLAKTMFPCGLNGEVTPHNETDCLWKDSGCGTSCLDGVASELDLW